MIFFHLFALGEKGCRFWPKGIHRRISLVIVCGLGCTWGHTDPGALSAQGPSVRVVGSFLPVHVGQQAGAQGLCREWEAVVQVGWEGFAPSQSTLVSNPGPAPPPCTLQPLPSFLLNNDEIAQNLTPHCLVQLEGWIPTCCNHTQSSPLLPVIEPAKRH